ncbi:MAG TPA: hypothetical protein VLA66_13930 [Thermoanaerobaculia bacterium]|nr:hypothetical protein [Thermoanaerobaculia bacterium]
MERRQHGEWIAVVGIALALVTGAACRRAPEPVAPAESAEPAPAASAEVAAELPAEPPADPGEEPIAIEPGRDEASGLELSFGLALTGAGELRDPVLSFGRGDRVCLVAKLPAAAAGEALRVRWHDALGTPRGEERATLTGSPPAAALCLAGSDTLTLGNYSVELEVDGRPVGDGAFTVADARESPRRRGS